VLSVRFEAALPDDDRRVIRARLGRMLRAAALTEELEELEASFTFTGDAQIHELNRDYRGKDRPTDVLAFAQREGEGGHLHPEVLGDVVISLETAERQRTQPLLEELLFLAAHGLCHLLGYDHQTDAEEAEMNARMAALLDEAGRRGRTRPA
jgi:probable rRNA maturation factor